MDSVFGAEGSLIVRFVVAFVIVLALIGLTFWLIRRFGTARVGAAAQRGRQPRLAVIDAAQVDGRRRLVLVRRDHVEHLLLIGGPSDFVVEQNIVRAVPVNSPRDVPVPRPPEGARPLADAARTLDDDNGWAQPEPVRPSAQRPEPVARNPRPETLVRAPLPPSLTPRTSELPPSIAPVGEPAGAPDAALASMAQRLEAALRRPGAPEQRNINEARPVPKPVAAPVEFSGEESPPPIVPEEPQARTADPAKSRSVLDSLEEEMASLLGRPPEKT